MIAGCGSACVYAKYMSVSMAGSEASGLDRDRVLELADAITVDPRCDGRPLTNQPFGGLEVNSNQISEGQWEDAVSRSVSYEIDGVALDNAPGRGRHVRARLSPESLLSESGIVSASIDRDNG
jgi:hypothetical protein